MVDGAEYRVRIVVIHECARSVVDGLSRDGHVVRVHDAMDEAHAHPIRNECSLALRDGFEHRQRGNVGAPCFWKVTCDDVVEQQTDRLAIVSGREVLESADTNVTGSHAREHGAWQKILAYHLLAGRNHRERA